MAAKIQKRLLSEGKITKEMIESYVDAYAGIYGDDTDAYVEEIVADTYAGMNRTDYGTNQLRADVKMEVGQWQKKSSSARAPPAGNKWSAGYDPETASIKGQLRNSIGELNEMNVVASIQTPTKFTSKSAAAKWAVNLLAKYGGKVDRQGYGEIYFSPKDINKAVDYADTNEEKAAVAAAPMVLKRGKEIGGHQNHKGREKQTITFAAPVVLNGQRGNMAVVVNKNGNHYYTHRIVTPDGRTFVFNKEDAAQEPSRGVTVSGSLADTTSAASKASISKTGETVKGKFSASADQTSAEQRKQNDKTALDYFGRTYKWSETGYVLLNGARLDFSGRHEGGPGGYRTVDHRDIIDALGEDYGGGDYSGGMVRFMQEGNAEKTELPKQLRKRGL